MIAAIVVYSLTPFLGCIAEIMFIIAENESGKPRSISGQDCFIYFSLMSFKKA